MNPGDLVIWRGRTTVVRVINIDGRIVTTAGRNGVSAKSHDRRFIRFWIRRSS